MQHQAPGQGRANHVSEIFARRQSFSPAQPLGIALLIFLISGISGCASNPEKQAARDAKIAKQQQQLSALQAVKTVSIDPRVVLPDEIHYLSAGKVWGGALGGLIGGAIAGAASPQESIKRGLERNRINVGAILVDAIRAALSQQNHFRLVDHDADATVTCNVKEYGFHVAGAFTTDMKVLLKAECQLLSRDGTQLFRAGPSAWSTEATWYTMDEYFNDRVRLLAAFNDVSATIATKEVNSLLRRSGSASALPQQQVGLDSGSPSSTQVSRRSEIAHALPKVDGAAPKLERPLHATVQTSPNRQTEPTAAASAAIADHRRVAFARQGANLRTRPTSDGSVTQPLTAGTKVELSTQFQNGAGFWWYVNSSGLEGWVAENELQMP